MNRPAITHGSFLLAAVALIVACDSATPPHVEPPPTPATVSLKAIVPDPIVGQPVPGGVVAMVKAANGRPVAGAVVQWAVLSGGGALSNSTTASDTNGTASAQWTLGTVAGPQSLEVSVAGLEPETLTVSSQADSPITLDVKPDTVHFTGLAQKRHLEFIARDRFGNRVSRPPLTWQGLDLYPFSVDPKTDTTEGWMSTKGKLTREWAIVRLNDRAGVHTWEMFWVIVEQVLARVTLDASVGVSLFPGDSALNTIRWSGSDSSGVGIPSLSPRDVGLTMSSSAPEVATVDSTGMVRGIAPGIAIIRGVTSTRSTSTIVVVSPRIGIGGARQATQPGTPRGRTFQITP